MKGFNFFSLMTMIFLFCGCIGNKQQNKINLNERRLITREIENMKSQFPITIPNTPMKFVDVSLENDMVVFVASLPKDIWEESFSLGTDVINSDKNLARVLNNVDHQFINKFIKAGLGLKYTYKNSDNEEVLMTIEADCARLKKVKEGIDTGEIVPYTTLEIFQMELDGYEFPSKIEEGLWMTDGYIRDNTVYYIATLESNITSDDLSLSDVREFKEGILEGLKETLVAAHKKEMEKKDIRIVYIYRNNNGEEFVRVEITSDDL